jgi:hypothetical protein
LHDMDSTAQRFAEMHCAHLKVLAANSIQKLHRSTTIRLPCSFREMMINTPESFVNSVGRFRDPKLRVIL